MVDAISLFAMDQRRFDEKYNSGRTEHKRDTRKERKNARP